MASSALRRSETVTRKIPSQAALPSMKKPRRGSLKVSQLPLICAFLPHRLARPLALGLRIQDRLCANCQFSSADQSALRIAGQNRKPNGGSSESMLPGAAGESKKPHLNILVQRPPCRDASRPCLPVA